MIMARNNTGDITTSFSDTAIPMRNLDEDFSAGAKLRLRAAEDGKLGGVHTCWTGFSRTSVLTPQDRGVMNPWGGIYH